MISTKRTLATKVSETHMKTFIKLHDMFILLSNMNALYSHEIFCISVVNSIIFVNQVFENE
jgi:hypothetical protein